MNNFIHLSKIVNKIQFLQQNFIIIKINQNILINTIILTIYT